MHKRVSTILMVGIFAAACSAVAILPAGCQSFKHACSTDSSVACPLCGGETRTQPLTGLKCTTCVCPKCKKVSTIDPETLQKLEDVFGYMPEFQATVCQGCGAVVRECATCRKAHGS